MTHPDCRCGTGELDGGPDYAAELGLALLQHRLASGLSLRALARRLSMSGHGGLSEYEKGRRIPPEDLLSAWADALAVPSSELDVLRGKALAQRAARKAQIPQGAQQPGNGTWGSHGLPQQTARPAQLPPDIGDFTGRHRELELLRVLAAEASDTAGRIAVIWGEPGIGKTTLATRLCHAVAADYPDGQLHVNLRGAHDQLEPSRALSGVLRALGVAGSAIPPGLDERAALYRSMLAGSRALVLLDDAATEAQVRPLLPGGPHCLAIVTSRAAMSGLAGAQRIRLTAFSADEAGELLAKVAGAERVEHDRESRDRLLRLCGYLPLAVRIAANRLANWPGWPPKSLADRLEDERARLAELTCGDLECRGAFLTAYQALDPDARSVFRCLGHISGPDFTPELVAVLTGQPGPAAGAVLDHLAGSGLLQAATDAGRYRLHDLLKIFALERSRLEDDEATRQAALRRMDRWLLRTAGAAGGKLAPPTPEQAVPGEHFTGDQAAAIAWLDAEWPAVLDAARRADDHGLAAELFAALGGTIWYFDLRYRWEPLAKLARHARDLAGRADLPDQEVLALNSLGLAQFGMERYQEAEQMHRQAAEVARSAGYASGEGTAWNHLGLTLTALGRLAEARHAYRRAAHLAHSVQDTWTEASAINHLGGALRMERHLHEAAGCHRLALRLLTSIGDTRGAAMARNCLGFTLTELGLFAEARDCHERGAATLAAAADEWGKAYAMVGLGCAFAGLGQQRMAIAQLEGAREIFNRIGDQRLYGTAADLLAALSSRAQPCLGCHGSWRAADA